MIGDWVSNVDGTIVGKVECIDSIKNRVVFGDHTLDAEFVRPIPLNPCVLERNGFERKKDFFKMSQEKIMPLTKIRQTSIFEALSE